MPSEQLTAAAREWGERRIGRPAPWTAESAGKRLGL